MPNHYQVGHDAKCIGNTREPGHGNTIDIHFLAKNPFLKLDQDQGSRLPKVDKFELENINCLILRLPLREFVGTPNLMPQSSPFVALSAGFTGL